MIRKLLATTAIATLLATGALAQTAPAPGQPAPAATESAPAAPKIIHAEGHLATNVIGQSVYNSTGEDASNIGKVNDLVIGPDNQIDAVVIGVGGFLGIGSKDVAIEYGLVNWAERDDDRVMVVETSAEALAALPEFDRDAYRPMPADADISMTEPATAEDLQGAEATAAAEAATTDTDTAASAPTEPSPGSTPVMPAPSNDTATAPTPPSGNDMAAAPNEEAPANTDNTQTSAIDRSTLQEQPIDQISSEQFVGTTVYGANDENIGEIGDVVLNDTGQVEAVIVDVGGFLGIGEKPVAVGMENLSFMADEDGKLHLYTAFTREQLEAQPAYDESSFAQNRDGVLLTNPVR